MSEKKRYSIIIPVLDEGSDIVHVVQRLEHLTGADRTEIIVVDGDAGGSTIQYLDDKIIKITSAAGRARQMNAGAARATGDILIFLHADTELPVEALGQVEATLKSHDVGAFDIRFIGTRPIYKYISAWASWRSRVSRIPYGDQCIFIQRELFKRLGGYADIPLMEDIELMQRLKKIKKSVGFIRKPVKSSTRRWEAEGVFFTMNRNLLLSTLFYCGVSAEKLAVHYKNGNRVYRKRAYE